MKRDIMEGKNYDRCDRSAPRARRGVCRSRAGSRAESRSAAPLPPINHHVVHRDGQAGLPLIANV
jgi:hypothetical protein